MAQLRAVSPQGKAECRHHWVIATPNGALSGGRCKRCGATRDFRNSSEDLMWDSDSFSLHGSRYRGRKGQGEREKKSA